MSDLLIDEFAYELPPSIGDAGRVRGLLFRAKHFVLDPSASRFLRELGEVERDLVQQLNEFALPPFDVMAITNLFDDGYRRPHR